MKQAKAMYRGGEVVSAKHCDYESYKELGLLCPFCDEPVFLVRECVRQRQKTHKVFLVEPHFSHYKGGDITDINCELRSRSVEGQTYLEQLTPVKKGQRLDLFNKFFWEMVRDCNHLSDKTEKIVERKIPLNQVVNSVRHVLNCEKQAIYRKVDSLFNSLSQKDSPGWQILEQAVITGSRIDKIKIDALKEYKETCNTRLDLAIAHEAVDFLATHKGRVALRKLIANCVVKVYYRGGQSYNGDLPSDLVLCESVMVHLAITRWQEELELKAKIKQETRGLGFG